MLSLLIRHYIASPLLLFILCFVELEEEAAQNVILTSSPPLCEGELTHTNVILQNPIFTCEWTVKDS